jgi:hypothetical protein
MPSRAPALVRVSRRSHEENNMLRISILAIALALALTLAEGGTGSTVAPIAIR